MKLTDEKIPGVNLIRAYTDMQIQVNERIVRASCVVSADTLVENWRPRSISDLIAADLDALFALTPEIIILGTGTRQKFPPRELLTAVLSRGIGCEVMDTGAACRTYNVLISEDRRVAAALIVAA
jgi:uncharacterized protein